MIELSQNKAKDYIKAEILYELNLTKEKLKLFEKKYGKSLEEFEAQLEEEKENFEKWDDYIEWKSYKKNMDNIEKRLIDIENENIKITG
ncbi:hypothetical protein Flexsi_0831 [Flexistipes sinusarabici DSM 4947]|uniref:Uncharacterized protein n=1 Tax=Flexistipes sinusarabici (strain ATCC 49648 / DSM 4947 / MAS 10) TaxID=717231 RepID=F8E4S7_FLESM|nr:hypothetical protein [Flexistipes sinusarabici]AEI14497.1 hypothetical protein Flexsi_0831 [Flexistipes sinusarabici DSM 4947]